MIFEIIMYGVTVIINFFAQFLPGNGQVPLLLPWGTDDIVSSGVAGFKVIAQSFPPFDIVLQAFLIYIGFKIILRLLKAVPILGRTLQ